MVKMSKLLLISAYVMIILNISSCTVKNEIDKVLYVKTTKYNDLTNTLSKAQLLLDKGSNVEVRLSEGTYYISATLKLKNISSNKLTIVGSKSGKTTISGAKKLTVNWEKHNKNIFKAKINLNEVDQLFIKEEQQIRARYPNFQENAKVFNGYAADAISPERTKHWKNPKGAFLHALHKGRWGGMHYEITGKSPNGSWALHGGFQNNRASPLHPKYRFVENVFEELDAPKEWFFDTKDKTLYFYPDQLNIKNVKTIEIPHLQHLVDIVGTKKTPVNNIEISHIIFSHSKHTFMQTKEPLLRSDWTIYRGGAINIEHAKHIAITDNVLVNLGGNAIAVNRFAKNIVIEGNHISQIGAGAINFVGDPSAVRSPSFTYKDFEKLEDMDFTLGPKNNLYPQDSIVHNNLIHDIGKIEKQVAGVQVSMAKSITISHNSIYKVPRAGINVSEGTWGGHLIEFNDVFHTVLETGDHGAFNSWGRDRFWHPKREVMNKIAKLHPTLYQKDAIKTVTIRNNRFQSNFGWDIDLDDGSSNYDIYNNVMLTGGLKFREGFRRHAYNNIMINNTFHPHVWFENSQDKFKHNIVLVSYKPILVDYWGDEIDYNLFSTKSALKKSQDLGLDEHSVYGQPLFVNAQKGDYRVKAESEALTIGFKNFPMDKFGVVSKSLKKIAETPEFPELLIENISKNKSRIYNLLGARIKSVNTLGEQSATGIPDMSGVIVLSVEKGSLMDKGGLKANDVIFKAYNYDRVLNLNDFLKSYQSGKWRKSMKLKVYRNQSKKNLTINTHD